MSVMTPYPVYVQTAHIVSTGTAHMIANAILATLTTEHIVKASIFLHLNSL